VTDQACPLPSIEECVGLACVWEVMAPKPGNVHRAADFEASTLHDFITSAIVIAPIMRRAVSLPIGKLVLESVEATARWIETNTNLGLILLLAPLAKAASQSNGIVDRRTETNLERDGRRRCPGLSGHRTGQAWRTWIGHVGMSPMTAGDLMAAMAPAAERDAIALQYSNGFEQIFRVVVPELVVQAARSRLADAIVYTQMRTMAEMPDSLIARKCGPATAQAAAARAQRVLQHAAESPEYFAALADFDFWLRADGNRRNPGTTADLIGAGLFVALRNGMIKPPLR
jgi:triphosphoribosyl-dephospho-CoA synthase